MCVCACVTADVIKFLVMSFCMDVSYPRQSRGANRLPVTSLCLSLPLCLSEVVIGQCAPAERLSRLIGFDGYVIQSTGYFVLAMARGILGKQTPPMGDAGCSKQRGMRESERKGERWGQFCPLM